MKRKQLIEVHSDETQLQHCACCDGKSVEVNSFYKELEGNNFGFQTYLDCCKDKVGQVVDWYPLEKYQKIIKKENYHGIVLNRISGYQKSS